MVVLYIYLVVVELLDVFKNSYPSSWKSYAPLSPYTYNLKTYKYVPKGQESGEKSST